VAKGGGMGVLAGGWGGKLGERPLASAALLSSNSDIPQKSQMGDIPYAKEWQARKKTL
jgi:hypothetical protein